jgi:hypothetical protein
MKACCRLIARFSAFAGNNYILKLKKFLQLLDAPNRHAGVLNIIV